MFPVPPWIEPRTAYLHIPFCGHHCGYCDFAVTAGRDHLIELYLDALAEEMTAAGIHPVETRFIGGGTPTYLTANQLDRLLTAVTRQLPGGATEFSIESTPESLDAEKAAVLAGHGITRVSVGVQSFHPHLLTALDRRHGVDHIPQAIEAVRRHGMDLSLDLIFAAPGQTLADWRADVEQAIRLGPDHISTYGLTYEKGTPLWKDRARGRVVAATEDAELAMYEFAIDRLTAAGYEHYEVSNFARPGKRCRHNERYWANDAYFGFGVGAARYVNGSRELNVRDTQVYLRKVLSGESPTFQSERLEPRDRAFETVAVQLRRMDGVERGDFRVRTGFELDEVCGKAVGELVEHGLLQDDGQRVRLTRRGVCVADGVVERVMRGERPA
jgi:oxygen-independent coproporphyrinogen-3 oxidase